MKLLDRYLTELCVYRNIMKSVNSAHARAAGDNSNESGKNTDENINAAKKNATKDAREAKVKSEEAKTNAQENTEQANKKTEKAEVKTEVNETASEAPVNNEAAMYGASHVRDADPSVINLGSGVVINNGKFNADPVPPQAPPMYGQNPYMGQQPVMGFNPMAVATGTMPQQPPVNGQGRHKVDNPPKQKPVIQKAEADQVNVDLGAINVETNPPKPPKQWPDTNAPLTQAPPAEEAPKVSTFDNSAITSKYKFMAKIEKLALECGVQLQMHMGVQADGKTENGLIRCIAFTPESDKPNTYKGFTIDTGMIIDNRKKMYPTILNYGYEACQAYPIMVPGTEKNANGKAKDVFNEEVFRALFTGGNQNLPERGMYGPELLELNKNVALITMPTSHMSKDTRKAVKDRLFSAMKAKNSNGLNVFDVARSYVPNCRFVFKDATYDKKTQAFVLTSDGVPMYYGAPYVAAGIVEIEFTSDSKTTVKKIV